MTGKPKTPPGLGPAGRGLFNAVMTTYELEPHEEVILLSAARQADTVTELEAVVKRDGATVQGSSGQPRLHPALVEARQARLAVAALLGRIDLRDEEGRSSATPSVRGRRAARTRWDRQLRAVGDVD